MGDVATLVRSLALGQKQSIVESKAKEYFHLSRAKLGLNALGAAETARAAVCVELACLSLEVILATADFARRTGTTKQQYANARAIIQRGLGIKQGTSPRELCIQFGCAHLEPAVRSLLQTFKERFLEQLAGNDTTSINFARPAFMAAGFVLVARKNRVKADKARLRNALGLRPAELAETIRLMTAVLPTSMLPQQPAERSDPKGCKKRALSRDAEPQQVGQDEEGNANAVGGMQKCELEAEQGQECEDETEEREPYKKQKVTKRLSERLLRQATLGFADAAS
jgi:origin recognition complex subunit 6